MSTFTICISSSNDLEVCRNNGASIGPRSQLFQDLADCCGAGDAQPACEYVRDTHKIRWECIQWTGGKCERVPATHAHKARACKAIYFESESDFDGDEKLCEVYLIWQAAHDITQNS